MSLPMKEYVVGGQVFEIVDGVARDDISVLKTDMDVAEENILALQKVHDEYGEDIEKLKLVSITPDQTLGIEGACADSKAVGDAINQHRIEVNQTIDNITPESINAVNASKIANNMTTIVDGYVLDARQAYELNLLIQKRATTATYKAYFKASDWTVGEPHAQTVPVDGILETDNPFVDIDLSYAVSSDDGIDMMEQWGLIGRITANNGTVTAYCYTDVPIVDIGIIMKVVR